MFPYKPFCVIVNCDNNTTIPNGFKQLSKTVAYAGLQHHNLVGNIQPYLRHIKFYSHKYIICFKLSLSIQLP